MVRLVVLAAVLLAVVPPATGSQTVSVLRIKVALVDTDQKTLPVPRHALLVSDDPPSAAPRRVVTALDGTATIRLRAGTYTVESDRPVAFQGREYLWRQTLKVLAGEDAVLELTAANAEVGAITSASTPEADRAPDASDALMLWQDSVVALWTPTTRASGFVIDARGLVATNAQGIGAATAVEVQLTPTAKVKGSVLVADRVNDVAVLWIDPAALASTKPVPLGCGQPSTPPLVNGQEVAALGTPMGQWTRMLEGPVSRVASRAMIAALALPRGTTGGPVFGAAGTVVGLTSFIGEKEGDPRDDARVVRIDAICEVVAGVEPKMKLAAPPDGARLPVEPSQRLSEDALEDATKSRAGSLSPYRIASAAFDVALITPVSAYAGSRSMDFYNWADYVAGAPSVLLVRITPKLAENLLTKVARGVAMTQGVALPPIKRFTAGFARMRALCGGAEVTPIHPFLLERRLSETDAIHEGLYVFDPAALGPQCGGVTFELYSEKEPARADTAVVDPNVIQQVWQDFAPYRALK